MQSKYDNATLQERSPLMDFDHEKPRRWFGRFLRNLFSVAASSETKIFGIGHHMTTAEILDELQVRNWISEEEAIPTFQVLTDWAPLRRSEFELKTDEERIEYYDLVQGAWRDPFGKK